LFELCLELCLELYLELWIFAATKVDAGEQVGHTLLLEKQDRDTEIFPALVLAGISTLKTVS
jgi:hypothetical protein